MAALTAFDALAGAMRSRIFDGVPEDELVTTLRVLETIAARLMTDPGLRDEETRPAPAVSSTVG